MMKCPNCGAETRPNAKFCQVCGAKLEPSTQPVAAPSSPAPLPEAAGSSPATETVEFVPEGEPGTTVSETMTEVTEKPAGAVTAVAGGENPEPEPEATPAPAANNGQMGTASTQPHAVLAAGGPNMLAESADGLEPATAPEDESTAPLPAAAAGEQKGGSDGGALHYKVLQALDTGEEAGIHRYIVSDEEPWRVCWSCGSTRNTPENFYCDDCGAVLGQQRYILYEECPPKPGSVLDLLAQIRQIPNEVEQPGLLRVYDVYENEGCRYALTERPVGDGPEAFTSQFPVEADTAMEWVLQVGNVLELLHQYRIFLPDINLSNLMRSGELIRIVNLEGAVYVPPTETGGDTQVDLNEIITGNIKPIPTDDVEQREIAALAALMTQFAGYNTVTAEPAGETGAGDQPADQNMQNMQNMQDVDEPVTRLLAAARNGTYLSLADFLGGVNATLDDVRFPPDIRYEVGSATDVGRQRDHNEDGLLTLTLNRAMGTPAPPIGLFVVADGMGGHQNGEVASQMALEAITADVLSSMILPLLRHDQFDAMSNVLEEAVTSANRRINSVRRAQGTDMGTTVTMALIIGSNVAVANAGDSRTYFVETDGKLEQISVDHSLVARLVAAGQITPDEIYTHPQRNQIYRSLGDKDDLAVDTFIRRLRPGEGVLLCSDGLWEMVHDPEMTQIIHDAANAQDACDTLIKAANKNGGEDNISAILVRVHKRQQDGK